MYEINQRVLQVREHLKMTRKDFGAKIGVSDSVVKNIDYNKVKPKPLLLSQICYVYGIDEKWLLYGEGNMFPKKTREEEIIEMFGKILNEEDTFQKRFIYALARLDSASWDALEQFFMEVIGK